MPCAICLENLVNGENGDPVIAKTCGHIFHTNCLNNWFRHSRRSFYPCPLCNNPIMGEQNVVTLDLKSQIVPPNDLHALKNANSKQRKVLIAKRKCCCKEDYYKRVNMQKLEALFEERKAYLKTLREEDDHDFDVVMENGDDEDESDDDDVEEDSDDDDTSPTTVTSTPTPSTTGRGTTSTSNYN